MKTYLKIKGLSLAAEARIIKRLEKSRQTHPELRKSLHNHRTYDVRREARSTHLALGFLRGTPYTKMELPLNLNPTFETRNVTRTRPDWKRVEQLVRKYGIQYYASESELLQRFAEFKDSAEPK